jgi:hypothetical protein
MAVLPPWFLLKRVEMSCDDYYELEIVASCEGLEGDFGGPVSGNKTSIFFLLFSPQFAICSDLPFDGALRVPCL